MLSFAKYEGIGNDFVVVDAADEASLSVEHAKELCDRHFATSYRTKAAIQLGLKWIVRRRLYRSRLVRAALQWGYGRDSLETTKHV